MKKFHFKQKLVAKIFIIFVLMLWGGCSQRGKELQFGDASKLFEIGMSFDKARQVYGEPSVITGSDEKPSWIYSPNRLIEKNGPGELLGFIISFRENRAVSIEPYTIVIGQPRPL